MIRPEDLIAKKGDDVVAWSKKLAAWAKQIAPIRRGTGILIRETPDGTEVRAEPGKVRGPRFPVALGDGYVTVGPGTVEGEVPFIGSQRLDGTDASGKPVAQGIPSPRLSLENAKPGEDGRSFICIRVRHDQRRFPKTSVDPSAFQIVHLSEIDEDRLMKEEQAGVQPIGILHWNQDRTAVSRVWQIALHDLRWFFVTGRDGEPDRMFFSAV